ncbi:hypothetical protein SAMN05216489_04079 [Streptomyces sp. 3213]|uniref:hypothetical protein n=1 Tax=Streptomyces sp. 3213.3 TaxID=1855348 RepID=UPI00089B7638|nr:hypothetical protein [Streptomyces sp. 3213.3]SED67171.1 hypothetical protein SAMN05216489_04079 [Streptomyces sp. 3213] [Streptomyces sp. 3213.3]
MSRVTGWILVGLLLVTGLAGCASARSAGPGHGAAPTSGVVDLATRSGDWPRTEALLQNAVNRLDERCLRAAGFAVPSAPAVRLPAPGDEEAAIGLAQRRTIGYGIATPVPASAPPASETYANTLSALDHNRYGTAQFGSAAPRTSVTLIRSATVEVASGGCVGDARRALAGDLRTWARLTYIPDQLDTRLSAQAMTDPRYLRALADWRTCLRGRGFSYISPEAAQAALRKAYPNSGGTAAFKRHEIAVAVADGTCARTAHLPTVLLSVRRSLVSRLPSGELSLLRSLNAERRAALARATTDPGTKG